VVELPVEPSLVEPVDVLGDGDLDIVDRPPGTASRVADEFALEQRVVRLGQGVVV
jgi:hypothetical protein